MPENTAIQFAWQITGIHAEPTSFGLKYALWYEEAKRNLHRLKEAISIISWPVSGAVGNYAHPRSPGGTSCLSVS